MRANRWFSSSLYVVMGLLVLGGASVAAAQASALGSPYPPATGQIIPVTPPTYSDVTVPAPPSSAPAYGSTSGIYAAPRGSVVADSPDVHIGTTVATRLRALDADLQILAARGGGSFIDGVLMLVSAAATVTWGLLLPAGPTSYASIYLYTYAGGSVARAILSFALMTNPSAAAIRYSHMPMGTMGEVRERLHYGELQLDGMADQARLGRILDGSINVAIGLAIIPAYLGPSNFQIDNISDAFLIVLAGVATVMGVVTLVSPTEAERRQSAYHDLRDRILSTPEGLEDDDMIEREQAASAASALSFSPILNVGPTGGFAGGTLTF